VKSSRSDGFRLLLPGRLRLPLDLGLLLGRWCCPGRFSPDGLSSGLPGCSFRLALAGHKQPDLLPELSRTDGFVTPLLALHGHQQLLPNQHRQQEARGVDRLASEEITERDRGDGLPGGDLGDGLLDVLQRDPFSAEETVAAVLMYADVHLAVGCRSGRSASISS
jgi:hypothetical protein